jgi:hypothetical protein
MSTLPPVPPASGLGPPPWPQAAPSRPHRWPVFASLVIALLAIGLAIGAWLRPLPGAKASPTPLAPSYTSQQAADAKANVCAAFGKVDHALDVAEARGGSNDPTAILAAATSERQALDAGSRYLLRKLAEEPAAPTDLATAVRNQADSYQESLIDYLDGLTNSDPDMQPALKAADEATLTIRRLCK